MATPPKAVDKFNVNPIKKKKKKKKKKPGGIPLPDFK